MDLPVDYYPNTANVEFNSVLECLENHLRVTTFQVQDKIVEMRYRSCVFRLIDHLPDTGYIEEKEHLENPPQIILDLQKIVESITNEKYAYVRAILYRDGTDYIGYHRDRESIDSPIASISLGTTRRFLVKADKTDLTTTFLLKHGDVLFMRKGCQRFYKHSVPKMSVGDLISLLEEKNIPLPKGRKTFESLYRTLEENQSSTMRISLTFRH